MQKTKSGPVHVPEPVLRECQEFYFRSIHEKVFLGTASDRYAGWIGQIYSPGRYGARITRRSKKVGTKTFTEEVLPVESVQEYFLHFRVLEIDFTFYSLLLDEKGEPTRTYRVLSSYARHLKPGDCIILKVPQVIFARKVFRKGEFVENENYLKPSIFTDLFYEPAVDILGDNLKGFVFEQEYQKKEGRTSPKDLVQELDTFFRKVPDDSRYHIEFRTESYLCAPVFELLEKYGIGQVLSHWTWLPRIRSQFVRSKRKFFNSGNRSVVRLMTPRGVRYEDAYAMAHPFDTLKEEMLDETMIGDTVEVIKEGIRRGVDVNVIVNNRAGGNAPLVARRIGEEFLKEYPVGKSPKPLGAEEQE